MQLVQPQALLQPFPWHRKFQKHHLTEVIATGTVNISCCVVIIKGQKKLFQAAIKVTSASAVVIPPIQRNINIK